MNESSLPMMIALMKEIAEIANRILLKTKEELHVAKEKSNKKIFVEFLEDLNVLARIIKIAKFIEKDVQRKKISEGTPLLLEVTNMNISVMLSSVVANKKLHEKIIINFKKADALMNNEF
jgi:hypothetical protein